jgi:hypothetical protein
VPLETPSLPEPDFFYLRLVSQATGHDYRQGPNEARLAVFARTLTAMELSIRTAVRNNTITERFREQVLRPELTYIVRTIDRFRLERSVKINGGEQTLRHISDRIDKAIIQLNNAAQYEQALEYDQSYWNAYFTCYHNCANLLQEAYLQIGNVGINLLPRLPP